MEIKISDLPHIKEKIDNSRRVDILCYNKNLEPLLLVECKEQAKDDDLRQLLGYNHTVGAPFIALVSRGDLDIRLKSGELLKSSDFPSFIELANYYK